MRYKNVQFLGAFTKLRKATFSFVVSVRLCSGVPGGVGFSTPPQNSEVSAKSNRIANWAENVLCSYSNILISLKIAEFKTPTPQDVRKKGSKILKLPRFAIVLHLQWQINWLSSQKS